MKYLIQYFNTGLPNFPSYISGHSTFSGAAATILGYIIPSKATMFNSMADEASLFRLYGAIHYRWSRLNFFASLEVPAL